METRQDQDPVAESDLAAALAREAEEAWEADEGQGETQPPGADLAQTIAHLVSADPDGVREMEEASSDVAVMAAALAQFRLLPRQLRKAMTADYAYRQRQERRRIEVESGSPEAIRAIAKMAKAEAKRIRKAEAWSIACAKHEDLGRIPVQGENGFDYAEMSAEQRVDADEGIRDLMVDLSVLRIYDETESD
jgi:hypothetical protein